ncbi:MAG: SpoVG family protein [Candidatus Coatesbacteria bacterium]|nr:SpoVG family protein [Candidatus Coatesbacteria bacterium]
MSDVRIYPFESREGTSQVHAYADVTFDGELMIRGFKVVLKPNGALFVGYPSTRQQGGDFVPIVAAQNAELKSKIREAVVAKYREYFPKLDE